MADIVSMTLTRAGLKLYGKVQAGLTKLMIPRIAVGDGELGDMQIYELEALKHAVNTQTQIISYDIIGDGQLKLTFRITGTEDFYLREIGVMATDPDDGEILYCYCNYGEYADYVMTYGGEIPVMQEADIYFAIGAAQIDVKVNKDTAGVTHLELEEHTGDKDNPHEVTAAQLFPDNSETLSGISDAVKSGYDKAAAAAHSHDNGTALDKITQEAIDKWNGADAHVSRRNNPHGVTKEQVGLGNVTNESKATMFTDPVFTGVPKAPTAEVGTSTTQIATTEFVHSILNANYGDVTIADSLAIHSATGHMSFYHGVVKMSRLLDSVETTFGKAVFGESYGDYSPSVNSSIRLYVKLRVEKGIIYWDEYYNPDQEKGTFIGTAYVYSIEGGATAVDFTYINDDETIGATMSMRQAIIELAGQIQFLKEQLQQLQQ